jgi:hypothetical protein
LDVIYSSGGSRIAPGGDSTGTLHVRTLQLNNPTTFDYQIGGTASDFIAVDSEFRAFSGPPSALFQFTPAGMLSPGTLYDLMSFSGFSLPTIKDFGLAPEMTAAGWRATFSLTDVTSSPPLFSQGKTLSVTFSAVPEPSPITYVLLGLSLLLFQTLRVRRRAK